MPDFGVHVTLINQTDQPLQNDPKGTTAEYGGWVDVPSSIEERASASFVLADHAGLAGSEGYLSYFVANVPSVNLRTYQTCPWGAYDNKISITNSPPPTALYEVNFRARSGDGGWEHNSVPPSGHPVYVEYTLSYQSRRYRFRLDRVSANSAHPVRNSRNQLVVGDHELWTRDNPAAYEDGTDGSLAPIVFSYDFKSLVAAISHLDVTVTPLDLELSGAQVVVFGSVDGRTVFQTDNFFLGTLSPITISAHPVQPNTSDRPFAWNAAVEWRMELVGSRKPVEASGPHTTVLELYWIAKSLHPAFQNGLLVNFMRQVLKRAPNLGSAGEGALQIVNQSFYQGMTDLVFGTYSKIYDTYAGASAFGMYMWGGIFELTHYLESGGLGPAGSLFPYVNCMDQAAMLQLACSLMDATSWLCQAPFGFINTTHLVGITDDHGILIAVNNPFFGTQSAKQYALLPQNDPARTWFGCHVYVGNSKPFVPASDAIYDACSGPHRGVEVAQDYVSVSIDTTTTLYQAHGMHPGDAHNIAHTLGVTGIDGQPYATNTVDAQADVPQAGVTLDRLLAGVSTSIDTPAATAAAITHTAWAHLPVWLASVLDGWTVRFGRVGAADQHAHALYQLADPAGGGHVRVSVSVHTQTGPDGAIDPARCASAAREHAADVVSSTDLNPEALWVAGELHDYGDWSLQYRPEIHAGRFLVCAGNTVVDISGRVPTEALAEVARRLLGHVVRRDPPPLGLPVLHDGTVISHPVGDVAGLAESAVVFQSGAPGGADASQTTPVQIEGVGTRFSLAFAAESPISAAGAMCDSPGLIFDNYVVEEYVPASTSGESGGDEGDSLGGVKVVFTFYAKERGHHIVRIHVADSDTMVTATRVVEVNVV